jgi:hypothetical protein
MHEISKKAINPNTKLLSNCGLVWDSLNDGKEKKDWRASINSLEDLEEAKHCTVLIDDIYSTILQWNTEVARVVSTCANAAGKEGLDIIITAQREVMIPPALKDIATSWIVPIITIRDNTRINARGERGYPVEMRAMYFNSEKILRSYSEPIRGLDKLFESYSTVERAKGLKKGEDGARPNQPGYQLEVKAFEYLSQNVPGMNWEHLNGKHVFDIVSDTWAIDVCTTDADGDIRSEFKDLTRHIRTAKKKGQKPYLMFPYKDSWGFLNINYRLNERCAGKKINVDYKAVRMLAGIRTENQLASA